MPKLDSPQPDCYTDVWLFPKVCYYNYNNWERADPIFIFTRKEINMVGQPAMDNWDNEGLSNFYKQGEKHGRSARYG